MDGGGTGAELRGLKWHQFAGNLSSSNGSFIDVCNWFGVIRMYTGRSIMFSVITNIYSKKTKGPTLMEFFTATGKLKKFFFDN